MRRILVVDDDPQVGVAIQSWLRDHGFQVQLAGSSAAGLTARDHCGPVPHRRCAAMLSAR